MKKTFWQWLTTPVGCKDYYDYWNKILAKNEKVVREKHRRVTFDYFPSQRQLDNLYKKGKLTEEQYEDLTVRTGMYQAIRLFGYYKMAEKYADSNKYFQKYYYKVDTEKRYANGKTFSEIFNN